MKLTQKLLGYLNRVFDKGPGEVLALRLRYDGAMRWKVDDGFLSTVVTGGTGTALLVDLSAYTIGDLAAFLASQPGYSVPFVDATTVPTFSALALIDGGGDQALSNGDHLQAFTSVLWAYLTAQAAELTTARLAIAEALVQMSATTASGEWVDEHGTYYKVERASGESDAAYASRMVAEVGKARGNGIAIGEAVRAATQGTAAAVLDVPTVTVSGGGVPSYGLFDLVIDLDANAPLAFTEIDANARSVLESMRDAGTHLRTLRYYVDLKTQPQAQAALQVGSVVTVLWDDGFTDWTNSAGQIEQWINSAGSVLRWYPTSTV